MRWLKTVRRTFFCLVVILQLFVLVFLFLDRRLLRSPKAFFFCSSDSRALNLSSIETAFPSELSESQRLCTALFLRTYDKSCRKANVTDAPTGGCLCPCVPTGLVGRLDATPLRNNASCPESVGGIRQTDGRWMPDWCIARQRIAIIIPFRDREANLTLLLKFIRPMLQRQLLDFTIYVIEQVQPELFNRASLMNVGFVEARSRANYDCYFFHDVDLIPVDDRNFYICSANPRHVGMYHYTARWKVRVMLQYGYYGGITAFRARDIEAINGFSNEFFGWGGEDDDVLTRMKAKNITSDARYPECVSRYHALKHERDEGNPVNKHRKLGLKMRPAVYDSDGLNSLNYTVLSYKELDLYTRLTVNLMHQPSQT